MKTLITYKFNFLLAIIILSLVSALQINALPSRDTLAPSWSRQNSPATNDITFLKVDSNNVLYMGVWGQGIGRSNNDGQNWVFNTTGLSNLFINCFDIDSTGNWYAGTNGGGIFKTTNNGLSWTAFNSGLTNMYVKAITIKPGGTVFIGTYGGGVYRLKKGAVKWEQVNTGLWFLDITSLIVTREGSVMAGTNGDGIYRTDDDGDSWRKSTGGLNHKNITNIIMDDLGQYYCCTLGGGLYISVTMGVNWSLYKYHVSVQNVSGVAINRKREPVVSLADFGIWRYDDQIYFEWRKSDMSSSSANCIVRNKNNVLFAGVTRYGLMKSTNDGTTWIYANSTFKADTGLTPLMALGNGLVLSSDNNMVDLYISKNYGKSWTKSNLPPDTKITAFGADSSGRLLVGARKDTFGYLYGSADQGTSWSQLLSFKDTSINVIAAKDNGYIFLGLLFPPPDPKTPSPTSIIMRSTDYGTSWTKLAANAWFEGFKFLKVNKRDGAIFTVLSNGINRSVNNGTNWTKILDSTVMAEDIDFDAAGNIYVGTDQGFRKSTNNGGTWTSKTFGFPYPWIKKVLVTRTNVLYLAFNSNMGVLRSDNGGNTFDSVSIPINRTKVEGLTLSPEGYIYLSTPILYRAVEPEDMVVPSSVSPADLAGGVALNPTLVWNSVPKADLYELQIARDLDFVNMQEKVVSGDTFRLLNRSLNYNEMYFWRVRSRFNNSLSDWSPYQMFTTVIKYPILESPQKGANGIATDIKCKWFGVDGAGAYVFQASTDPNFSSFVANKEVTDTTFSLTNLQLYTKYYWRVKAKANKTFSDWSEVWNFTTKLRSPNLKAPANHAYGLDTIATMEWEPITGATGYEIQIAKDSLFKVMIFEGETQTIDYHTTKLLEYFTTYFWRIRSKDDFSVSDWSYYWSFTTIIDKPILISPENRTNDMKTDTVHFEWEPFQKAEKYHLIVAKDNNFTDIIYNDSSLTKTFANVTGMAYNTTYYWKVKVIVGNYSGLWSETRQYSTGINKPNLISPPDNSLNAKIELIFNWDVVDGATFYQIQIASDDKFSSKIVDENTVATNRYEYNSFTYETKYFWRVKATYDFGQSEWSPVWNFTTEKKNPDNIIENIDGVSIKQYPNPAKDDVYFEINSSNSAIVSLSIYSANGNKIKDILTDESIAGKSNMKWITDGIASGSYICRFSINGKEYSRIINIIK